MLMPFNILGLWLRGLFSIAILAGGIYLLTRWYDDAHVVESATAPAAVGAPREGPRSGDVRRPGAAEPASPTRRVFRFDPGWNRPTYELAAALALLAWATAGRWIWQGLSLVTMRSGQGSAVPAKAVSVRMGEPRRESKQARRAKARRGKATGLKPPGPEADEDPREDRTGAVHVIRRPDGSELRVECHGPVDGPPIVFTHGWGANSTEWFYQKRHLADRFRLIVWDEPGLGLSKQPDNGDYRMENLAADLNAVLDFAGDRPAVLLGHSIGGMITLTFCKEFPEALGTRVAGLVLAHTSYTNPVRTADMAGLFTAIEKPVLIPLMHLTIALWPLAWLMAWMNYINGSTHRSSHKSGFSGHETRGQLNFVSRLTPRGRPDVLARGMLGMIRYDATHVLPGIGIPTLVVVGDLDGTTKPEAGRYIAEHVPRATLETLSPAKHMGLLEHHERFDRLVADFVAKCQAKIKVG